MISFWFPIKWAFLGGCEFLCLEYHRGEKCRGCLWLDVLCGKPQVTNTIMPVIKSILNRRNQSILRCCPLPPWKPVAALAPAMWSPLPSLHSSRMPSSEVLSTHWPLPPVTQLTPRLLPQVAPVGGEHRASRLCHQGPGPSICHFLLSPSSASQRQFRVRKSEPNSWRPL